MIHSLDLKIHRVKVLIKEKNWRPVKSLEILSRPQAELRSFTWLKNIANTFLQQQLEQGSVQLKLVRLSLTACRPHLPSQKVGGHGNNEEMESDAQQQITRSLLGRCLIKDQFSHIYCLELIVCSNEIQMGKAKDDDSRTEEWVRHWPATSNVGRCESIGLLAGCWCESSGIGLRRGLYKDKPAKIHKKHEEALGPLREAWDACIFWKT